MNLDNLRNEINGYNTVIIKENTNNINVLETKYVLLPVWVLNIKYKDKIYHFAMNGESGKMVGEIPVDTKKLVFAIIVTFVSSCLLILIVLFIMGYRW